MSLIHFHRFLIVCGILFCLGYAGWEVNAFRTTAGTGSLLLAVAFTLLAALLGVYLWQLNRWLGYEKDSEGPDTPRTRS